MENAYQPELWRDLYVMLGTSSAALIGLLFVVTSLHLEEVMNNAVYRLRARNVTFFLLALLIQAVAILTPQPKVLLGAELVAINLCGLCFPVSFVYWFFRNRQMVKRGGYSLHLSITYIVSYLLGIAGGAVLVERSNWGLYLVTVSYVIVLVAIVWNAWTIMLGVGQAEKITKANEGAARRSR